MRDLRRTAGAACLSDLQIDRLLADDLAPEQADAARAHAQGCARCRERLAAMSTQAQAFSRIGPPLVLPEAPVLPLRRSWRSQAIGSLAAAAAVALVIGLGDRGEVDLVAARAPDSVHTTRTKGGASFGVWVQRGDRGSLLMNGDVVHPDDVLVFGYGIDAPAHLAVFGVDGAGTVGVYFPAGTESFAIEPARAMELPSSLRLDATLGHEHLFAVFCPGAFVVEDVRGAIEALPRREVDAVRFVLPTECTVETLELDKRPP